MKNKFSIALSLAVIVAMLVTSLALADSVGADNDVVSPGNQSTVDLTVSPGAQVTTSAQLVVDYSGSRHLVAGSELVLQVGTNTLPSGYSVSDVSTTVPDPWNATVNIFVAGNSNISFTAPSADGIYQYTVKWDDKTKVCSSGDCVSSGNAFTINLTVETPPATDTTAPVLSLPDNITIEATGPSGAAVTYSASANDAVDGPVTVSCTPTSGSTFALGTTIVNCSAKDAANNTANGSFTVTVVDTTPPTLTLPNNITAEATGPSGAAVSFTASASDLVSGSVTVDCTPATGSTFALGTTTVNCSAKDSANNIATGSFNVTVVDTTPPSISCGAADSTWHADNQSVTCTATDLVAPLSQTVTLSTNVSSGAETDNAYTDSQQVCDAAGNCAEAGPVGPFKIDRKAPSITISVPTDGASYLLNQSVESSFSCADGGSDVAICTGAATVDTSTAGPHTFTVTATDNVGNSSSASATYSVNYAVCALYDQTKSHKKGSTVPIKLQLCDVNGVNVSSASIVVRAISVTKIDSSATGVLDDSGAANSPDMNFRYDATLGVSGGYIFNLSTKSLSTGTWKVNFTVDGSGSYSVQFDVK